MSWIGVEDAPVTGPTFVVAQRGLRAGRQWALEAVRRDGSRKELCRHPARTLVERIRDEMLDKLAAGDAEAKRWVGAA